MDNSSTPAGSPTSQTNVRRARACAAIFFIVLGFSVLFARIGWSRPLLDTHPFRQAQTAISSYWLEKDGFRLAYETPVVGAPWSIPYEFPLYQYVVARVHHLTHGSFDATGRAVSLGFFWLSLPAIWLLLRRLGATAAQCWLFLTLLLATPVYQFYGRTFLIESTAFCIAAWFLYLFHRAVSGGGAAVVAAAAIVGCIAGLAKVTTYAVFLVPALWFTWHLARTDGWSRWHSVASRAAVAAVPGVVLAWAWIGYTDRIKKQNLFGALQTSAAIHDWNYGTLAQRLTGEFWQQLGAQLVRAIFPLPSLLVLAVLALLFVGSRWRVWLALLSVGLFGPLVFANLYAVHDYYFFANGVFLLLLLAYPLRRVFENETLHFGTRLAIVSIAIVTQFLGYMAVYLPMQKTNQPASVEIGEGLKASVGRDDVILGFGLNWNPLLPYYAERRALMVPDEKIHDDAAIAASIDRLKPARIAAVIIHRGVQPSTDAFLPWVRRLGMDEIPLFSTGDLLVFVRRDLISAATQALKNVKTPDLFLYNGQIGGNGQQPQIVIWTDQMKDLRVFAKMHPTPTRVITPFGVSQEPIEGRLVVNAPASSTIDIPAPKGAHRLVAHYGINPKAYPYSDGVEFEIMFERKNDTPLLLYRRLLQPWLLVSDQGLQTADLQWSADLEGTVSFRTKPGLGNANSDWSYWSDIDVH